MAYEQREYGGGRGDGGPEAGGPQAGFGRGRGKRKFSDPCIHFRPLLVSPLR